MQQYSQAKTRKSSETKSSNQSTKDARKRQFSFPHTSKRQLQPVSYLKLKLEQKVRQEASCVGTEKKKIQELIKRLESLRIHQVEQIRKMKRDLQHIKETVERIEARVESKQGKDLKTFVEKQINLKRQEIIYFHQITMRQECKLMRIESKILFLENQKEKIKRKQIKMLKLEKSPKNIQQEFD